MSHNLMSSSFPTGRSAGPTGYALYIGLAGLSAVGVFAAIRCLNICQEAQRKGQRDIESRRRLQEEQDTLRRLLTKRDAELEQEREAKASLHDELEGLAKRLHEAETEHNGVKKQNETLADKIKELVARNKQQDGELQKRTTEQKQMKELLEARTGELKGAQTFLTKADQLSGADVIKLVEELNGEIMQTAASMAEQLVVEEKKLNPEGKEQESDETRAAIARTEEIIGPRLTDLLRMSEHHEDPILIQTAFQAGMAAYTHWMISSWCFESPEDEHMLSEIYARVREAEEQAVSGRWRQLTRTHLQRMMAHEPDLLPDLAEAIANIVVAAGYKEGPALAHRRILSRFSESIGTVMKLARNLNKKVGEGVTSCDLEVLYITPDISFNKANMEDALGTSTDNGTEKVICTTDLGLVRAERLSGPTAHWNESVLLKPKVILPSGLEGIVGGTDYS